MNQKLWCIVLAVWLVLWGLLAVSNLQFQLSEFVLAVLAIAAGVLLVLDR